MFVFEKTISISFADFVAFNKIHVKRFRLKSRWIWIIGLLLSILMFLPVYNADKTVEQMEKYGFAYAVFTFAFVCVLFVGGVWLLVLLIKLLYRFILFISYKLNSHIFINVNVLINEKGIDYKTGKKHCAAFWPQIVKVYDDGLRYFIYYAENAVFILPKHYLGSLDQRQEFANFLKAFTNTDLKYTTPNKYKE